VIIEPVLVTLPQLLIVHKKTHKLKKPSAL
jgi:hypothetical protein